MKYFAKIATAIVPLLLFTGFISISMNIYADEFNQYKMYPGKRIIINKPDYAFHRAGRERVFVPRSRHYRDTRIMRPYGHPISGYGFLYSDEEAYKWLAFTSITLKILDNINEEQQRLHEQAQIRATTANVGESIIWEDGTSSGSVKTTRIGKSTSGHQCREFQQTVTIGRKTEQAYGTACLQADGTWELFQ